MTHHVAHTNKMLFELKEQYQDRITELQQKITEQQQEILQLQEQIRLLSREKYYDC
jgi:cell division protein FtsL